MRNDEEKELHIIVEGRWWKYITRWWCGKWAWA